MDTGRTPAQQEAMVGLLDRGGARPTFPGGLALRLLDRLEDGLAPLADRLDPEVLNVNKGALSRVLSCEGHQQAVAAEPFAWTAASARGTVVHRALQMAVFRRDDPSPLQLVDDVVAQLADEGDDWSPRDFLRGASPQELADLRATASDTVTRFQECFPAPVPAWRPRMESPARVELCGGRIVLRSKVDLALGRPHGQEARVLVVDFKTGRPWPGHLDDLRFYALLEAVRVGVPPFRVASYYLDAARWQHEDVTLELLELTVRRVVAGVTRLVELHLGDRAPTITPCAACGWCPERSSCAGADTWQRRRLELEGWEDHGWDDDEEPAAVPTSG